MGGVGTAYLRGVKDVMVLSVVPKRVGDFFSAWTAVPYVIEAACFAVASVAKRECGNDSRVSLSAGAYFECQSRTGAPGSGASAALKNAWKGRDWIYCISGDMLLGDDDEDTFALAMLRKGLSPRTVSASRDQPGHNYCKMLYAVHTVATARSEYFKSNVESGSIPMEEVAEYVADTWRKLAFGCMCDRWRCFGPSGAASGYSWGAHRSVCICHTTTLRGTQQRTWLYWE